MLATFVIGLREGLEAALIVGIIAAFLKSNSTANDLRKMWAGVGTAVALCIAVGIGLEFVTNGLPQREQEMLECVIAAVAVVMVSFMILWMKKHSRGLKAELEGATASALEHGSAMAMVAMAFLAVLREGFETAVFLVAAFQSSTSVLLAVVGAFSGIVVALFLGWLIYRGGVRFNMSRFFRITGVVLVLVAAGLVMKTFRAAHEAGWLHVGQQQAFNFTGFISPGSVTESLVTGVLGIQARPALVEVLAYLLYAVLMLLVVLWPPSRALSATALCRTQFGVAALATVGAALSFALAPSVTSTGTKTIPVTGTAQTVTIQVDAVQADAVMLRLDDGTKWTLRAIDDSTIAGIAVTTYQASKDADTPGSLPPSLRGSDIKDLRGGRYPVGMSTLDAQTEFAAAYTTERTISLTVDPRTGAIGTFSDSTASSATVTDANGSTTKVGVVAGQTQSATDVFRKDARDRLDDAANALTQREIFRSVVPPLLVTFAVIILSFAVRRRARPVGSRTDSVTPEPVKSEAVTTAAAPVDSHSKEKHHAPL